ncbi:MAG: type III polyketide synthase [Chloroflexi bacterium]|nr:type III polyketide synthase [Chloroflexota bacterium]
MSSPAIVSIATHVPGERYSQDEIFEQMHALKLTGDPRARKVFEKAGVGYRHAIVNGDYFAANPTTEARNACYLSTAIPLGEETIRRCLDAAGCDPTEVDDLIIVSCTGIDTPGLDLRLAGRLGMRPDLRRTGVLGMGCYAAFPGLLRAREAVRARQGGVALVLTLELCSLHMQLDDSLENMVSAALFADGAAAALIGDRDNGFRPQPTANGALLKGPRLVDAATHCDYTTLEHMAFRLTDHGFQMRLSAYVPDLLAAQISGFIDGLLARNGLSRGDVGFWGVHPGSGKILDYVQEQLALADEQMRYSREVLHDYGNMSSATILFILDAIQRQGQPQPGDYGMLMAFGPGLTMESMLVQW